MEQKIEIKLEEYKEVKIEEYKLLGEYNMFMYINN